jgi:hypothetical protein
MGHMIRCPSGLDNGQKVAVELHRFVSSRDDASCWLNALQMKKTFPLNVAGLDPQRVIDGIKHDVRKYVKRERRKAVPAEADFWDFTCKIGINRDTSETKLLNEVNSAIDAVVLTGAAEVYIEILAVHGRHVRHPAAPVTPGTPLATAEPAAPAPESAP